MRFYAPATSTFPRPQAGGLLPRVLATLAGFCIALGALPALAQGTGKAAGARQ